ncbi:hypothetical protein POTOM_003873 [Populus tomentosa]|uniref:Protein kinase domain-containing protein n=1 Tax=Populus tomentosa TaxID=118781 RepID=A0A8X8AE03_POPTO|nr:hypothetical protein POTOM_003873 [Populus tomentosa]
MIPRSVSLIFLLLFLVPEIATVSALMTKPNCTETCGNISVPFPFGIGAGCSMNDWFSVDCNKTTADSPSRAFLRRINMEVFKISLGNSRVRVNSPIISSGCSGRGANLAFNMTGSPFVFSSLNIFIAMGCNNRALLNQIEPEIVGCTSTCGDNNLTSSSTEGKKKRYCSGNNCCQTRIPSNLQVFSASLGTTEDPNDQGRNQCKVAFIVDQAWALDNIKSPEAVQDMQHVPVFLDWYMYSDDIRVENSDARNCSSPVTLVSGRWGLSALTLRSNSTTCSCNSGYDGNPYLPDGCTDIDECKNPNGNWCSGLTKCVNVPGGYKCELDKAKITFLNEKFRAKVSDFGTSRSIAIDQTHLTTHVQGTFGYFDPEYFQSSKFTGKSDVYSFGVVLAELLSGQKPISYERSEERGSLATHFILLMEENKIFDILDERIMGQDRDEEVIAVANLARRCLNLNGRKRPTMREVAIELEQIGLSKGALHAQQSSKELENIRDGVPNAWEIAGTPTSVTIGDFRNGKAPSLDVQPLISQETCTVRVFNPSLETKNESQDSSGFKLTLLADQEWVAFSDTNNLQVFHDREYVPVVLAWVMDYKLWKYDPKIGL